MLRNGKNIFDKNEREKYETFIHMKHTLNILSHSWLGHKKKTISILINSIATDSAKGKKPWKICGRLKYAQKKTTPLLR